MLKVFNLGSGRPKKIKPNTVTAVQNVYHDERALGLANLVAK